MKKRLDVYLHENGLTDSRQKAKALIMAGDVFVDGRRADKASLQVSGDNHVRVAQKEHDYASRGGVKLEKALKTFGVAADGKTALDIGASSGGFTDCLLKNGAEKVYCVDVGYGQLDWRLRNDPRVVVMERTNARYLKKDMFPDAITLAVIDVSFISLELILPAAQTVAADGADIIALIKPQFEAGREKVGKRGVVKDPKTHVGVIEKVFDFCKKQKLHIEGVTYSPVTGPNGNIEFFIHIVKSEESASFIDIPGIVEKAHARFQ